MPAMTSTGTKFVQVEQIMQISRKIWISNLLRRYILLNWNKVFVSNEIKCIWTKRIIGLKGQRRAALFGCKEGNKNRPTSGGGNGLSVQAQQPRGPSGLWACTPAGRVCKYHMGRWLTKQLLIQLVLLSFELKWWWWWQEASSYGLNIQWAYAILFTYRYLFLLHTCRARFTRALGLSGLLLLHKSCRK
jgi:hypothetical protein